MPSSSTPEPFFELTTADEKTKLAADQEKKMLQLEEQLKEAHTLIDQITQEKAELETELQLQQVRYACLNLRSYLLYMYTLITAGQV